MPQELSPRQVLIRVYAVSMNPVNWKILNGNMSLVLRYSFSHIPGSDVVGAVIDGDSAVKRLHVGDHVYGSVGTQGGAYAEYIRADENLFALKPTNLSMEEVVAIPMANLTSYQTLITAATGKSCRCIGCGDVFSTKLLSDRETRLSNRDEQIRTDR